VPELLEKGIVHEARLKELWGDKVVKVLHNNALHAIYCRSHNEELLIPHNCVRNEHSRM
jgi:hypothetical protein